MRLSTLSLKLQALLLESRGAGVRGLLRSIASRLSPRNRRDQRRKVADARAFDEAGYDTGEMALLDGMTIVDGGGLGDANPYDATPSYDFDAAIALLDIPLDGATFVDLGSGKGRTLMLAARHCFAEIVGVEIAEELQAIARGNLQRFAELQGADLRIELVTSDAGRFSFPETPLVVFLFNPFGAKTLAQVAGRLKQSWRAAPRPVRVIYVNPQHADVWRDAGFRQSAIAPDFKFVLFAPD